MYSLTRVRGPPRPRSRQPSQHPASVRLRRRFRQRPTSPAEGCRFVWPGRCPRSVGRSIRDGSHHRTGNCRDVETADPTTYFASRSSAHACRLERPVARRLCLTWLRRSHGRSTPRAAASPSRGGSLVRPWGRRPAWRGGRAARRSGWCRRADQPRSSLVNQLNCSPILKPCIGTETTRPRLRSDGARNSR